MEIFEGVYIDVVFPGTSKIHKFFTTILVNLQLNVHDLHYGENKNGLFRLHPKEHKIAILIHKDKSIKAFELNLTGHDGN